MFSPSGGKGYDPEKADYSAFEAWLQCYYVDGMRSLRDHNGRTIWFKVSFPSKKKDILNRIVTEMNRNSFNCREILVRWCRKVGDEPRNIDSVCVL